MLTRVKETIDYITEMCSSKEAERQTLGKKLEPQCVSWTETLNLTGKHPINFMEILN